MKANLEEIRNKALPILKQAGVTRSSLFGSYVRGENKEGSDIDLLIDLPDEKSLFDLIRLKLELKETLKREVDLVEFKSIKPLLKKTILGEQVRIL